MKKTYINILFVITFVFVLGISINVYAGAESCKAVFSDEFLSIMKDYVYTPIKWLTPVVLIVLTSFDFAQVVFNGKKDQMDKAKNNFLKRAIAGLIIFFAPNIINLIISFINNQALSSCVNQFVNK